MELCLVLLAAGALSCGFVLTDGAVRRAIRFSLARRIGGPFSPDLVAVGDSLAESCPWEDLARRPLGVLNLSAGGATLKEIAGQVYRSRSLAPRCLLINGGLNDLLFDEAGADRIEADFSALLRRIGDGSTVIVTLMPYVSDTSSAGRIAAANAVMSRLCRERGYHVVDLNPLLSTDGVRRPDMTQDGLHFTRAAERIWIQAVRAALSDACRPDD